jgi:Family of unknown function (DUF5681)
MNSAPQNRSKRAPRGRPFAKGASGNAARQFAPGESGNPGGRPRRMPYSDACMAVTELTVSELKILPSDLLPIATAKAMAREAIKGKVQAATELANRAEGTPRHRHEITGADGNTVKVEAQLSQADFIRKIREIYGLSDPSVASAEDPK